MHSVIRPGPRHEFTAKLFLSLAYVQLAISQPARGKCYSVRHCRPLDTVDTKMEARGGSNNLPPAYVTNPVEETAGPDPWHAFDPEPKVRNGDNVIDLCR